MAKKSGLSSPTPRRIQGTQSDPNTPQFCKLSNFEETSILSELTEIICRPQDNNVNYPFPIRKHSHKGISPLRPPTRNTKNPLVKDSVFQTLDSIEPKSACL